MKKGILSLWTVAVILSFASLVCASDQLKFPETASEIINLLKGKEDVVQEINGVKYVLSNNILYKIIGGKRWKVRGLAGIEAAGLLPRVGAMILFASNSAEISERSNALLSEFGKALSAPQLKDAKFMIEGYTDSVGEGQYNQSLSKKRAESVKDFLVTRCHIQPDRLVAVGCGESKPIAPNDTDEGRQKNRRVEMVRLLTE